jgi:hypothetical protein
VVVSRDEALEMFQENKFKVWCVWWWWWWWWWCVWWCVWWWWWCVVLVLVLVL